MMSTAFAASTTPRLGHSQFSGSALPVLPARSVQRRSLTTSALFTKSKPKKQSSKNGSKGYDDAFEVDPTQPAFTRRREVFVGRLAMFGFSAALLGELATGRGALGQLQLELGLPPLAVDAIIFGTIAYSLLGAALPGSPTFSEENQRDVAKRPGGATQNPRKNVVKDPKDTLGVNSFGFKRSNEIFVGRTAQLGFLAAIIGEKITGYGPLKQFGLETGIPVGQASVGLLAFIAFFLLAAVFTGNFSDDEDQSQF